MGEKSQKESVTLRVVLDTSIFVNPDSRFVFGKSPDEAFINFLKEIKGKNKLSFFMPPSVYRELLNFIEAPPTLKETVAIRKQPPSSYESGVPAIMVYELIEEIRSRINKGLRIAEKYSLKKLKEEGGIQKRNGEEIIKNLRQEYRTALREGIIDSKEDFDLILLAKDLGGILATSDKGLIKWASKLGISCVDSGELKEIILGH
ncbi:MAG: RNA ligase partner protein [Candidatus Omnitrophica bacterium]|nr:RNA ligase partner protein [Candidatus Omnitrophota bacterium]MBD3269593.1 RNA ligase partner protein [Candidatus Omnitrophota bacterium]